MRWEMPGWSVGGTSSILTAELLQPAPSWVSCGVFCSQDSRVERTSRAWLARCLLMDRVIGSGPFLWVSLPSPGQEALSALPLCSPQHPFKYGATYKYTSSWALLMSLSFPKMSLQTTFPSCDCLWKWTERFAMLLEYVYISLHKSRTANNFWQSCPGSQQ